MVRFGSVRFLSTASGQCRAFPLRDPRAAWTGPPICSARVCEQPPAERYTRNVLCSAVPHCILSLSRSIALNRILFCHGINAPRLNDPFLSLLYRIGIPMRERATYGFLPLEKSTSFLLAEYELFHFLEIRSFVYSYE